MNIKYTIDNIDQTVSQIIDFFKKNENLKVVAFYGKMGSGKTTLIKQICENFGVTDEVTSPTFAIINEYSTPNDDFIYHFDFYRLKDIQEAINIAAEDYFFSGNYCFLEWPEIVEPILPEHIIKINITEINNNTRQLSIRVNE